MAGGETQRTSFERLLADLLARLAIADSRSVLAEIEHALRSLLEFMGFNRCSYFSYSPEKYEAITVCSVASAGLQPHPIGPFMLPFEWLLGEIRAGRVVNVASLSDLPATAVAEREHMLRTGVQASLIIPIIERTGVSGIIAFSALRSPKEWPSEWMARLAMMGGVIGQALTRLRLEALQDDLRGFEALVSGVTARLASAHGTRVIEEIKAGLAETASFLAADCCALIPSTLGYSHNLPAALVGWSGRPTSEARWADEYTRRYPWVWERLQRRETVVIHSSADYPIEATRDRQSAQALGHEFQASVPLDFAGEPLHALVLVNGSEVRAWSSQHCQRLQLLGQTLSGALARARYEHDLSETARRLGEAESVARLGSWVRDFASGGIESSSRILDIIGREISTASDIERIIDPGDLGIVRRTLRKARDAGRDYSVDYRTRRPDGGVQVVRERGKWLPAGAEISQRALCTVQDITSEYNAELETRSLRRQLWHADRVATTGTLTACIAHELNQPLAAILANAQAGLRFMRSDPIPLDEIRAILEDVVREDKRAAAIVSGLRSLTRKEAPQRTRLDPSAVVVHMLDLLRSELVATRVKASTSLSPDCEVLIDRTQLEQVLLNLVTNAIGAMHDVDVERRVLRVVVSEREDGQIEVSVRDQGIGVPPNRLDRLFDPFFTTKAQGTGLGLTICKAIVEANGGRIWAYPNSDHGTTFAFTLPAAPSSRKDGHG